MDLFFYKSPNGNVGDDFNPWIWEKILGDFNQYKDFTLFGVGSILDDRLEVIAKKKVIFGTGVRDYLFNLKSNLDVDCFFVRGPISSKALGGVPYITDSAYCLALIDHKIEERKQYELGYIPYFEHVDHFDWNLFELVTGMKVILPTLSVDEFLRDISKCKKVYCSAMHGAIFADILRIPWCRVRAGSHGGESAYTSELKWNDWCLSLNMKQEPIDLNHNLNGKKRNLFLQLIELAIVRKRLHGNHRFILSDKQIFEQKVKDLSIEVEKFKRKYLIQ